MVAEILRTLATGVNDAASADALVKFIYDTGGHKFQPDDWIDDFSDQQVLGTIFGGSTLVEGAVMLSIRALLLRAAFDRHNDIFPEFTPADMFHRTSNMAVAGAIIGSGFKTPPGLVGGRGAYFFNEEGPARDYIAPTVDGGGRPVVIRARVYSKILQKSEFGHPYGKATWGNNNMNKMVCIKNPLLIFPVSVTQL